MSNVPCNQTSMQPPCDVVNSPIDDAMIHSRPLAARLSIAWGNARACLRVRSFEEQVTPLYRVPMQIIIDGQRLLCQSALWPLRSSSLSQLHLEHALEFAIDDMRMIQEAYRVLAPGGELTLVTPNARGFGAIDGINAFRYVSDVTGRGPDLPEISEIGWRRHYPEPELASMLQSAGFAIDDRHSRGIAGCELEIIRKLFRRGISDEFAPGRAGAPKNHVTSQKAGMPVYGSWGARLHFRAHKPG